MDVQTYLETVRERLTFSLKIRSVEIADERIVLPSHGYFRARLVLTNDDLLEVSEYFTCDGNECNPIKYRYQWMDSFSGLIRRWDNANHFPDLPGFPHHVHVGSEENVHPSRPLGIIDVIGVIEQEIR